jgi:hypothetical protein
MSEVAPEVWEEISRQYGDGVAITAIAKAFNVSRARIKRQADELGWVRSREDNVEATPRRGRSGSLKVRRAAVASVADQRSLLIDRQRAAWDDLYGVREDAYRLLRGEKPKMVKDVGTDDMKECLRMAEKLLTMVEKDANSLMRAQEGQRRAYGVNYKKQQETPAADEAAIRRRHELAQSIINMVEQAKRLQTDAADARATCVDAGTSASEKPCRKDIEPTF